MIVVSFFQYVFTYLFFLILGLIVLSFLFLKYSKKSQELWFFWFYLKFVGPKLDQWFATDKNELFNELREQKSSDPELRKKGDGVLRVVEIGIGSGSNLEFYPDNTRLIAVDPSTYFQKNFHEKKQNFPNIILENFFLCDAEAMTEIEDNSIDAVVSTHVLCSVDDIRGILQEVFRVLTPGGKFYFLEHVGYPLDSWKFRVQQLVQPVWEVYLFGCQLTRNISQDIDNIGFSHLSHRISYNSDVLFILRPHVVGIATK
ncbi:methyltransferase-like protein 7A [Limulus polyphemus]|uniref:Methyltransferase-like protein 7A n=1 Tax=Limulus polyphemus TaxID=6850 RepID=A0ABM1BUS0_LIMPO|nr:methyltransferase-like protein 7A [Limulus polyphemus]